MKVGPSIRKRCAKCKVVKRKGRLYIICENSLPECHDEGG